MKPFNKQSTHDDGQIIRFNKNLCFVLYAHMAVQFTTRIEKNIFNEAFAALTLL